ncbi:MULTISPECIES: hypothetical protein [Priestia]|uniref:DUF1049 domain-containing protein n=1 Tax=Priestia aryabhattai TaxID=412384 RepID=A0ABD5KZA5_PRIAR|nr:hypothetical protein [Priestia megaterium]NGY89661.1 hypothetical protein [Priestia megaterium]
MNSNYKSYFFKKFPVIYLTIVLLFIIFDVVDSGKITLFSLEDSWNFILYQVVFCLIAIGAFSAFLTSVFWKIKKKRNKLNYENND